jgi:hypothetical protein
MAIIEESIEIKHPVDKVFAYTTDAKNWAKWQSVIPKAEKTSQGPVGIGTAFKGMFRMGSFNMSWTAKATEYEPFGHFGKYITSPAMNIKQHNTYDPIEGGVRFTITYDMKVRWLFTPFSSMFVRSTGRELKKSLNNLKEILETQT